MLGRHRAWSSDDALASGLLFELESREYPAQGGKQAVGFEARIQQLDRILQVRNGPESRCRHTHSITLGANFSHER